MDEILLTSSRWTNRKLAVFAGLLLALSGPLLWFRLQPSSRSLLFYLCWVAAAGGISWSLLAVFLPQGRLLKIQHLLTGNTLVFGLMLATAELGFRLARFDFDTMTSSGEAPREAYPVCFRQPEKPLAEVFFQRPGNLEWTGKPLSTLLHNRHGTDKAYEDEPVFTSKYDAEGFRNPADLRDWDVVVTGDSFTETGYLPQEEIFSSIAARLSGLRIKNLGVCNTGTFTHARYLENFAKAPSCKHAVLAFYDGNDVLDSEEEMIDLDKHQATGWRPLREILPQTSFLKAFYRVAKSVVAISPDRRFQNAWLTTGGRETPISINPSPLPPDPETMSTRQKLALDRSIDAWVGTAERQGLKPCLLYLPANNRTYHGLVRFGDNASAESRAWKPSSLPEYVKNMCEKRGIRFISAYPTLRLAAEAGTLVYNPILDTHFNREGSRLVGELLAKSLSDTISADLETSKP